MRRGGNEYKFYFYMILFCDKICRIRESMKIFKQFLLLCLCALPCTALAQVATTAGSNLTAFNPTSAAANNSWNSMTNVRSMANDAMPTADYGNCNSAILRCAQPKCSGCTSLDLARPIVSGCVMSNQACAKYGNDLIDYIAAQIVSSVASKAQTQQAQAQQAAASQNAAQMQMLQNQISEMQSQLAAKDAAQEQAIANALAQQAAESQRLAEQAAADRAATEQAIAQAAEQEKNETISGREMSTVARVAAESGVSEEVLARQQIAGKILTDLENTEVLMKKLDTAMQGAFEYAKCDKRGNNCQGPKRVKVFKEKALEVFEPYDEIIDEMYEALESALAVGVDVSDVIMMLNNSCNKWGKYVCRCDGTDDCQDLYVGTDGNVFTKKKKKSSDDDDGAVAQYRSPSPRYYRKNKEGNKPVNCVNGRSVRTSETRGGFECQAGWAIPPQDDARCSLIDLIDPEDGPVELAMLDEFDSDDKLIRVGCASDAMESIAIFGRRNNRRGTTLDLDVLERMILQDASEYGSLITRLSNTSANDSSVLEDKIKYCSMSDNGIKALQQAVSTKNLNKDVCVKEKYLHGYKIGNITEVVVDQKKTEQNQGGSTGGGSFNWQPSGAYANVLNCENAGGKFDYARNVCDYSVVPPVKLNSVDSTGYNHGCAADEEYHFLSGKCVKKIRIGV